MDHFYTQQKRQTPINLSKTKKKKKNSAKISLKKNRKTDGKRMQKKKKRMNETSGHNSIANLHMRQMSFVGKIDHLANVVLGWRITSHAVVLQWVHAFCWPRL